MKAVSKKKLEQSKKIKKCKKNKYINTMKQDHTTHVKLKVREQVCLKTRLTAPKHWF